MSIISGKTSCDVCCMATCRRISIASGLFGRLVASWSKRDTKSQIVAAGQLMINGKWRDAGDGATMPTSDPTTEQVITEVAKGSAADLDEAVRAATRALRKVLGPCCTMRLVPSFCSVWLIYLTTEPMSSPFARPWIWAPYCDFRNIIMPHCSGLFRFFGGLAMSGMSGIYRTSYEHC